MISSTSTRRSPRSISETKLLLHLVVRVRKLAEVGAGRQHVKHPVSDPIGETRRHGFADPVSSWLPGQPLC
jgi:hypothetical protein